MAAWNEAPAAGGLGECAALVRSAEALRFSAPELAVQLARRALLVGAESAGSADAGQARSLSMRAQAVLASGLVRLSHYVDAVEPAFAALALAEGEGVADVAAAARLDLAACSREVGEPMLGCALLRPVLEATRLRPSVRAVALGRLVGCAAHVGRRDDIEDALIEADRLLAADEGLSSDVRRLERARLSVRAAAYHRWYGDTEDAADAAREGITQLNRVRGLRPETARLRAQLVLELVCALLDEGALEEAASVSEAVLAEPVRATSAAAVGRLMLAVSTRVHLPSGRVDRGRGLLDQAVWVADRHGLDGLLADVLTAVSQLDEAADRTTEALESLRGARAAEQRRLRAMSLAARQLLTEISPAKWNPKSVNTLLREVLHAAGHQPATKDWHLAAQRVTQAPRQSAPQVVATSGDLTWPIEQLAAMEHYATPAEPVAVESTSGELADTATVSVPADEPETTEQPAAVTKEAEPTGDQQDDQQDDTDAATGLLNKEGLIRRLRSVRNGERPVALTLVRLDSYGATRFADPGPRTGEVADVELNELAGRVRDIAPENAELARSDGTELAVLLPHTTRDQAEKFAAAIESAWLGTANGHSISTGVVQSNADAPSVDARALINAARHALTPAVGAPGRPLPPPPDPAADLADLDPGDTLRIGRAIISSLSISAGSGGKRRATEDTPNPPPPNHDSDPGRISGTGLTWSSGSEAAPSLGGVSPSAAGSERAWGSGSESSSGVGGEPASAAGGERAWGSGGEAAPSFGGEPASASGSGRAWDTQSETDTNPGSGPASTSGNGPAWSSGSDAAPSLSDEPAPIPGSGSAWNSDSESAPSLGGEPAPISGSKRAWGSGREAAPSLGGEPASASGSGRTWDTQSETDTNPGSGPAWSSASKPGSEPAPDSGRPEPSLGGEPGYGSSTYERTKAELARLMSALNAKKDPPQAFEATPLPAPSRPVEDHPRNGTGLPSQSIPTPPDPDEVPEPQPRPDIPDPAEPSPIPPTPPEPGPEPQPDTGPLTPPGDEVAGVKQLPTRRRGPSLPVGDLLPPADSGDRNETRGSRRRGGLAAAFGARSDDTDPVAAEPPPARRRMTLAAAFADDTDAELPAENPPSYLTNWASAGHSPTDRTPERPADHAGHSTTDGTGEVAEHATAQPTDRTPAHTTDRAADHKPDRAPFLTSAHAADHTPDRASHLTSAHAADHASDRASHLTSAHAADHPADRATDRASGDKSGHAPDRTPDRVTDYPTAADHAAADRAVGFGARGADRTSGRATEHTTSASGQAHESKPAHTSDHLTGGAPADAASARAADHRTTDGGGQSGQPAAGQLAEPGPGHSADRHDSHVADRFGSRADRSVAGPRAGASDAGMAGAELGTQAMQSRAERSSGSTTIAGLLAEALAAYQETSDEPEPAPHRPAPDNDFDRLFDWRYQSPASGRHRSPE